MKRRREELTELTKLHSKVSIVYIYKFNKIKRYILFINLSDALIFYDFYLPSR